MNTYTYNVVATYDDCEIEVKTHSADTAIRAMFEHTKEGATVHVIDGFTGEIYVCTSPEDYWVTEEWNLMIMGWLMETMWEVEG
jgi:hypothetical protein